MFNTGLNDWLEAERYIKEDLKIESKTPEEYTEEAKNAIVSRAQKLYAEKIAQLNTALDDWLEGEKEIKHQLGYKINIQRLFKLWHTVLSAESREGHSLCLVCSTTYGSAGYVIAPQMHTRRTAMFLNIH
ncbi:hypothetical protein ACFL3D_00435 [Candidatus Omnitrophota bacterium]